MKKSILNRLIGLLVAILMAPTAFAAVSEQAEETKDSGLGFDTKEVIFEHLGDRYGWEVPFNHHKSIPLPIIVFTSDGMHCFSSERVAHGHEYDDNGTIFRIAPKGSKYAGKVVEIKDGEEIRPFDISITKNVCAIFITMILVIWSILAVARWHKQGTNKAPRGYVGAMESLITFIYDSVIKPTLKEQAPRFAPYLLTVFFFILFMNLLGLIVVFPGGANLTGNIAVTLVLAIFTFLFTNITRSKHYWKEIFWPDVPWWLKVPIPIMPVIELFSALTKPAALTIRLFANMMGGHIIVIVLTLLIFIFATMGTAVVTGTAIVSVAFSVFMLVLDCLVSLIQAYVFTMLSTIFIATGHEKGHHEAHDTHADHDNSAQQAQTAHA